MILIIFGIRCCPALPLVFTILQNEVLRLRIYRQLFRSFLFGQQSACPRRIEQPFSNSVTFSCPGPGHCLSCKGLGPCTFSLGSRLSAGEPRGIDHSRLLHEQERHPEVGGSSSVSYSCRAGGRPDVSCTVTRSAYRGNCAWYPQCNVGKGAKVTLHACGRCRVRICGGRRVARCLPAFQLTCAPGSNCRCGIVHRGMYRISSAGGGRYLRTAIMRKSALKVRHCPCFSTKMRVHYNRYVARRSYILI